MCMFYCWLTFALNLRSPDGSPGPQAQSELIPNTFHEICGVMSSSRGVQNFVIGVVIAVKGCHCEHLYDRIIVVPGCH